MKYSGNILKTKQELKKQKTFILRDKVIFFLFSLSIFFNDYFFLSWNSFQGGRFSLPTKLFSLIATLLFILFNFFNNRITSKTPMLPIGILLILKFYEFCSGAYNKPTFLFGSIEMVLIVLSLFLLEKSDRNILSSYILKVFVILMLPSLFFYILVLMNVPISPLYVFNRTEVDVVLGGHYYDIYPFGMIMHAGGMARLSGFFDEPGFVGTLSALLFIGNYSKKNKWWLILLALIGFFTISTAFYLLMFVFITINVLINKSKVGIIFLVVIVCLFVFVVNYSGSNYVIAYIKSKLSFDNFSDRRITAIFSMEFNSFMHSDFATVLFGKGYGEAVGLQSDAYTYLMLIYDYGIVGCILYIGFFISLFLCCKNKKICFAFFIAFIASIYQRPYVLSIQMVTIFISCTSFLDIEPQRKFNYVKTKNYLQISQHI